jgi:hypothetical protein
MSISQSSSTPVTSPSNLVTQGILDQLSGIAQDLSNQMLQWGMTTLAGVNTVTGYNIDQFLNSAATSGVLANASVSDYLSNYVPLQNQLIQDANSYNSDARVKSEMGTAESGTAQAMDQGKLNAEQQLQSYGIDPSSGRYAELEQAQNAGRAAAIAGAGQQARLATEATGRQLRGQAIAVGQQLPGQAINALNSEVQSLTGAENSVLGAANTGVNLTTPAIAALNTAVAAGKYSPTGQQTQSVSYPAGGAGGGAKGGGGGSDPFGIGNFGMGTKDQGVRSPEAIDRPVPGAPLLSDQLKPGSAGPGSVDIPNPYAAGTQQYDENGNPIAPITGPIDPNLLPPQGFDPNQANNDAIDILNGGVDPNLLQQSATLSSGQGSAANPFAGTPDVPAMNPNTVNNGYTPGGFDQQNDPVQMGVNSNAGIPGGASATGWSPPPPDSGTMPQGQDTSGFADGQNFDPGGYNQPGGGGGGGGGSGGYDPYQGAGGWYGGGYGGGGGGGGYGGYAKGGAIPDPSRRQRRRRPMRRGAMNMAGGGRVPLSASPSHGAQTDDVRASLNGRMPGVNVNAGEFVVPKDVAAWKGQEFFQKLIQQSRKSRVTAPAHGSPSPPQAMG